MVEDLSPDLLALLEVTQILLDRDDFEDDFLGLLLDENELRNVGLDKEKGTLS